VRGVGKLREFDHERRLTPTLKPSVERRGRGRPHRYVTVIEHLTRVVENARPAGRAAKASRAVPTPDPGSPPSAAASR